MWLPCGGCEIRLVMAEKNTGLGRQQAPNFVFCVDTKFRQPSQVVNLKLCDSWFPMDLRPGIFDSVQLSKSQECLVQHKVTPLMREGGWVVVVVVGEWWVSGMWSHHHTLIIPPISSNAKECDHQFDLSD